jgi:hypothetical protein
VDHDHHGRAQDRPLTYLAFFDFGGRDPLAQDFVAHGSLLVIYRCSKPPAQDPLLYAVRLDPVSRRWVRLLPSESCLLRSADVVVEVESAMPPSSKGTAAAGLGWDPIEPRTVRVLNRRFR